VSTNSRVPLGEGHTLTVGSMGLGYAVSANDARTILSDEASVWTGLDSTPITGAPATLLNVPHPGGGILVESVAIGSIAESRGLRPSTIPVAILDREIVIGGDIILSVQGIPVGGDLEGFEPIRQALVALQPGQTLRRALFRPFRPQI